MPIGTQRTRRDGIPLEETKGAEEQGKKGKL